MKCPECDRQNRDGAIMCAECGRVLVWPRLDGPHFRTSRLAIGSAVAGVVSILCAIADREGRISMCLFIFMAGVAGISAATLGVAALACIEINRPELKGRKYALIGILLSAITFILINALYART